MAALKIVACDNRETRRVSFRVYPSEDGDVRSCNVIAGYVDMLVDGSDYLRGEPDANEHPFYEIELKVEDTHKSKSKVGVTYQRLDFAPMYNQFVVKIHDLIYGSIKRSVRKSMNDYREEKRAKGNR